MPRISEFFGIVISMYYNDHAPPHFHARYAEHEIEVLLGSLEVSFGGYLPQSRLAPVLEWAAQHQEELTDTWDAASRGEPSVIGAL